MSKKSQLVSGMGLAIQVVAEIVRLARDMGVPEERLHVLGTSEGEQYLRGMITNLRESPPEISPVYPVYPDGIVKHLTPDLEAKSSTGVRNFSLGLHEKQERGLQITGSEFFEFLLPDQKTYQARWNDPIHRCISLADIQFYEKYPHLIPPMCKGAWVYAWKSVVLDEGGCRVVSYLSCRGDRPYVGWYDLGYYWGDFEPAGLSAS